MDEKETAMISAGLLALGKNEEVSFIINNHKGSHERIFKRIK